MLDYSPSEFPIYMTATFLNLSNSKSFYGGRELKYSREENPTVRELERRIAELDGFPDSLAFNSGMAAISTLFLSMAKKGILMAFDAYPTTIRLALDLKVRGFRIRLVPMEEVVNAVSREWGLVFTETITNPMLKVPDLPALAERCEEKDVNLVIDNTFASPILLKPSIYSSYSVQSATKYLSGHNDVIAGILSGNELGDLWEWRRELGTILDPFRAFLVMRGLYTLEMRVKKHSENALKVATFLESCELVERVIYPGLSSHPQHDLAKEIFRGLYGGVVTFIPKVDPSRFISSLKVIRPAPSLGSPYSLINQPISSASNIPPPMIRELGIDERVVRLSVGLEDPEIVIGDIESALRRAGNPYSNNLHGG